MKIGLRKPNIKSRVKAQTIGKVKREIKRSVNPLYGKSGMGLVNDPKKAIYNKIYHTITFGVTSVIKSKSGKEIEDYPSVKEFLCDVDFDSVTLDDIDNLNIDSLEVIYEVYKNKSLSKDNKKKLERIQSRIMLKETFPANFKLSDTVKTKSGKERHDFASDFIYFSNLDLSTFTEEEIMNLEPFIIKALFFAKNTSWKRKNEKEIYNLIEQRYLDEYTT